MNLSAKFIGLALASALSAAAFAQEAPGQMAQPDTLGAASVPGQVEDGAGAGGPAGGPGGITQTQLTTKSYPIAAGASAGNLEGAACPANFKMLSGACHPYYNPNVVIINQFPDIPANTWRCGFKNNTAASVTVYIYTLCGQ